MERGLTTHEQGSTRAGLWETVSQNREKSGGGGRDTGGHPLGTPPNGLAVLSIFIKA
jgi:hypothetical protein